MNNGKILKGFFGLALVMLTLTQLSGCVSAGIQHEEHPARTGSARETVSNQDEESTKAAFPQEAVPVSAVEIDGIAYPAGEVEKLVSFWNGASGKLLSDFEEQFTAVFEEYMNYLASLTRMPSQDNPEVQVFLDQLTASTDGFYAGISSMRNLVMARLDSFAIERETPYEISAVKQFNDLFPPIQAISIEGCLYPASIVNILRGSMDEISESQWALLSDKLEATLTTMYAGRKDNSRYFAEWVYGNWNHLVKKPFMELFGIWGKEYAEQYNTRINRGIDTELPARQITEVKDRSDVLLKGFLDAFALSRVPENPESIATVSIVQEMAIEEFFVPYTLLQNVSVAGELMGIDLSQWRKETNNRLAGAVGVGFRILDVAGLVLSKFNPVVAGVEGAFEGIQWLHHLATKGGKINKLEVELKAALDNELNQTLGALRSVSGNGTEIAAVNE